MMGVGVLTQMERDSQHYTLLRRIATCQRLIEIESKQG